MNFWRDSLRDKKFSLAFVLILGIGLSGFLIVSSFSKSLEASLESQSRSILSADLAVSLRRPFTKQEETLVLNAIKNLPFTKTSEFFSMLAKGNSSRLVLVRSIEDNYPLYGQLSLSPPNISGLANEASLFASDDLFYQLDTKRGDTLSLGGNPFKLLGSISEDPTQSFRTFAIGGRVYIHQKNLQNTNLIQAGSTVTYSYLVLTSSDSETMELKAKLLSLFSSPEIRITTAKEAGENTTRALAYMGDFLGLVSLISLLLSALGASYLFRANVKTRQQEFAIYRVLGMDASKMQFKVILHTISLALFAILPAILISIAALPLLKSLISLWSPIPLDLRLRLESLIPCFILCSLGIPILLFPELVSLKYFSPLALFQETNRETEKRPIWPHIPVLLLFSGLSILVSHSLKNALFFMGTLCVFIFTLFAVLIFLLKIISRLPSSDWRIRHSLNFLTRKRRSTIFSFIILSMGSLLMHLLPQIEYSLRAELETTNSVLPSQFLFDIQEEQKEQLEQIVKAHGETLYSLSPLVRARIVSVNGTKFERELAKPAFVSREDEQAARFRNFGVNLSYRKSLQDSESIIAGKPFASIWDGKQIPELSVEAKYAERMNLKMGDILQFDIQGVTIEGKIANLRRVRWTSFQPNFFLLFQDGVINEAPKSYIANISAMPELEKLKLQKSLSEKLPNISIIDVAAAIKRVLDLVGQMRLAILLLSVLALMSGFSVLLAIFNLESNERAQSLLLFRILGASEINLRFMLWFESVFVSTIAVIFGAFSSALVTYSLSKYIFDGAFSINSGALFYLSIGLILLSTFISWFASKNISKRTPLEVLRSNR